MLETLAHIFHYILRSLRISFIILLFCLVFPVLSLLGSRAGPRLLRWCLQTCGAGFVKFGQVLAMRYDLLPEVYCEELTKLLDQIPAQPLSAITRVIENEFHCPLKKHFAYF